MGKTCRKLSSKRITRVGWALAAHAFHVSQRQPETRSGCLKISSNNSKPSPRRERKAKANSHLRADKKPAVANLRSMATLIARVKSPKEPLRLRQPKDDLTALSMARHQVQKPQAEQRSIIKRARLRMPKQILIH